MVGPQCQYMPRFSHTGPSRQDVMMYQYNKGMGKMVDNSIYGAIFGSIIGMFAVKNKRKNMFRMAAIGTGLGAGYSYYMLEKRFSEINM